MTQAVVETRRFQMAPKLLMDVIQRQAGTLSKAILEGVMNAVDAKATKIGIKLTAKKVEITDDGSGFQSRENIEKWFEVFGQPHDETEDKTYGTFRIGRGQGFSFGVNTWLTGEFEMNVDIKKRGLDYDLVEHPEAQHDGCKVTIDLYEQLLPSAIMATKRDLELWCKYAPVPTHLNDKQISVNPEDEKWDHILDEAYVRLTKTGPLVVYNLGIHVMDMHNHRYGTGGVVVSKKQLKVNFARNDIQSDCSIWKKVLPKINQWATEKNTKARSLDYDGRQRLADQLSAGELGELNYVNSKLRLITGVTGRAYSIHNFLDAKLVTSCKQGDRVGERIDASKRAFVVADCTLERFGVKTLIELISLFKRLSPDYGRSSDWFPKVVDYYTLAKEIASNFILLTPKELNPNEEVWKDLAEYMLINCRFYWEEETTRLAELRIHIGEGPADGWTDGRSYIALARKFLGGLNVDLGGIVALSHLLLHELAHGDDDLKGHDHDQAFYEKYHDYSRMWQPGMVTAAVGKLPQFLESVGRKMTKRQLKMADLLAKSDIEKGKNGLTGVSAKTTVKEPEKKHES
jgi:hypothetical protein